jgi:hypothetical protein
MNYSQKEKQKISKMRKTTVTTAILAAAALSAVTAVYFAGSVINQAAFADQNQVLICHIPPDDPTNRHEILVNPHAVESHLENHGDNLGSCDSDDDDNGDGYD